METPSPAGGNDRPRSTGRRPSILGNTSHFRHSQYIDGRMKIAAFQAEVDMILLDVRSHLIIREMDHASELRMKEITHATNERIREAAAIAEINRGKPAETA